MEFLLRNPNFATDKGNMNGRLIFLLTVLPLCVSVGCSSYTLREGIWELSFQAQRHENRLEFPLVDREVRISVEVADPDEQGIEKEIVEIAVLDEDDNPLVPMYGEITPTEEERAAKLRLNHRDADWIWRMFGFVRSDELVEGTEFMARAHQYEDIVLEGRWRLRWLRDE